ncbi:Serine/threonine-protein kinase TOR [Linum grandiflorum]
MPTQQPETIIHLQTSLHLQLPPPRTPSTPPASKSSSEIRTESTLPASPSHPAASTSDILRLFHTLDLPLQPDLYVSLVKECTIQRDSASALRLHGALKQPSPLPALLLLLLNRLLLMHVSCGHFQIARQLFDEMRHPISWAILITAYSHDARYDETILLFLQMLQDDDNHHHQLLQFPRVAMVSVLKACMYTENKGLGKQLHGLLLKFSPTFADDLGSSLANFDHGISHLPAQCDTDTPSGRSGGCRLVQDAERVFEAMVVDKKRCGDGDGDAHWNAMLMCYLQNGLYVEALKLLYKMKAAAVEMDWELFFYQYPFNVPAYYALILRSLPVLEGLALNADPNFKVLAASYPDFAKRLLTYPNPYLRDALIELLFKDARFRWKRLENLLVQGSEDRDFSARDALQRVLKLLLGEDGDFYRPLQILIRPFCSLYYSLGGRVIGGVTQRLMDAHRSWWLKAGGLTSKGFLGRHLRSSRSALSSHFSTVYAHRSVYSSSLPLAIMALPAILNSSNNFELLRKSESEVFDMIESAITVAALRFPEKLLAQKHRIFKPYDMACRSSSTNDNDDGGYNSTGYNQEITKEEEEEPVYNQEITKEDEEEPTKPRRRIIRIKLVKDGKPTTATTVGSGTGATTATTVGSATTTVGRGMGANLKMASDVPWSNSEEYEKKLENSKRKLKEGYSKFEDSKKRSKVCMRILQRRDDALRAYTVKASQASSLHLVLEATLGMIASHEQKDHYANLYAIVSGEKHFLLLPPTDVHRMYIRDLLEMDEPARYVPWCSMKKRKVPSSHCISMDQSHFNVLSKQERSFTCLVCGFIMFVRVQTREAALLVGILPQVVELLGHQKEAVRKKAIMALHRFYQKSPSSVSHLVSNFRKRLCDNDPGVMGATLCPLFDLISRDVNSFKDLVVSFMNVFPMTRLLYFRYKKLQRWDDALRAYTVKASQASSLHLVLEAILGIFWCRLLMLQGTWETRIRWQNMCLDWMMAMKLNFGFWETLLQVEMEASLDKLPMDLWPSFATSEDYHSTVAVDSLMHILRDPSLASYHQKVLPDLFHTVRTCDESLKNFITWKLGTLVSIVRQHIRKYLPELLSLISELWSSFGLPATNRPSRGFPVLHIVEQLCLALDDEIRKHLPVILPCCIQVLSENYGWMKE